MRLIDADELKEMFKSDSNYSDDIRFSEKNILRIIDKQATAYDVDKVVAQLEKLDNAEVDYYTSNDVIDRIDAIDIVEEGGIDEL